MVTFYDRSVRSLQIGHPGRSINSLLRKKRQIDDWFSAYASLLVVCAGAEARKGRIGGRSAMGRVGGQNADRQMICGAFVCRNPKHGQSNPCTSRFVPGLLFVLVPQWEEDKKEEKLDFSGFSAAGGRSRTRRHDGEPIRQTLYNLVQCNIIPKTSFGPIVINLVKRSIPIVVSCEAKLVCNPLAG